MSSLAKAWETGLPERRIVVSRCSNKYWIVVRWKVQRTVPTLVVLEHLHGGERGTAGEQLMAELGLVVRLVGLLVLVAGVT